MRKTLLIIPALLVFWLFGSVEGQEAAPDPYGGITLKVAEPSESFSVKKGRQSLDVRDASRQCLLHAWSDGCRQHEQQDG